MEQLRDYILQIQNIDEDKLDEFLSKWKYVRHTKGEFIVQSGKTARYLHFTIKGIQKAFYETDDRDYIVAFTYPYAFTCVPESFLTHKPSKYSFQCLTDSEFFIISYPDFFHFVQIHHEFETLLRKVLINVLDGVVNRYHRLLTLTIEKRFIDFMENSPQLLNLISHKEIANYLKIDPTNFSKLLNTVRI